MKCTATIIATRARSSENTVGFVIIAVTYCGVMSLNEVLAVVFPMMVDVEETVPFVDENGEDKPPIGNDEETVPNAINPNMTMTKIISAGITALFDR